MITELIGNRSGRDLPTRTGPSQTTRRGVLGANGRTQAKTQELPDVGAK
jgi:hypothetical protein